MFDTGACSRVGMKGPSFSRMVREIVDKGIWLTGFGAFVVGSACAQSSVVLYGVADADLRLDHTAIGTLRSIGSGGEGGTRWGIRGAEDLGGGLKATFIFEQGFDIGDNSVTQGNVTGVTPSSPTSSTGGRLFSRTATVGLASSTFGEIRFGRINTPFYEMWTPIDPAGGLLAGSMTYAVGNISRFDNSIYYASPAVYGFKFTGAARIGESTTANSTAAQKNGGRGGNPTLSYASDRLLAGYSYLSTTNALETNTMRTQFAGAVYDLSVLKLHGLFFTTHDRLTTNVSAYAAGISAPLGNFNVFGQVARINNRYKDNNSQLYLNDANFFGLGANYNFSRRTDVYVAGAKAVNSGNAAYLLLDTTNGGLLTAANVPPGFNPWSFQVGIRHRF